MDQGHFCPEEVIGFQFSDPDGVEKRNECLPEIPRDGVEQGQCGREEVGYVSSEPPDLVGIIPLPESGRIPPERKGGSRIVRQKGSQVTVVKMLLLDPEGIPERGGLRFPIRGGGDVFRKGRLFP